MYQRILVATDGSTLSKKAVTHAIGLAKQSGAELFALQVAPRYPRAYFDGGLMLPPSEISKLEKQWTAQSQAVVDAVAKSATAKGIQAKGLVVKSELISNAIISVAKKQKCDLIVMASHGRKGLKRLLLGSETQQVLTHSAVPVLILR